VARLYGSLASRSPERGQEWRQNTTTVEPEWLRELLVDLTIVEKPTPAILINYDNQTIIVKVNSPRTT